MATLALIGAIAASDRPELREAKAPNRNSDAPDEPSPRPTVVQEVMTPAPMASVQLPEPPALIEPRAATVPEKAPDAPPADLEPTPSLPEAIPTEEAASEEEIPERDVEATDLLQQSSDEDPARPDRAEQLQALHLLAEWGAASLAVDEEPEAAETEQAIEPRPVEKTGPDAAPATSPALAGEAQPHAMTSGPTASETVTTPAAAPRIRLDAEDRREGRVLLRLLENGDAPGLEIAWPEQTAERIALLARLKHCYGMEAGVLTADGELLTSSSLRGGARPNDRDYYSGYVRSPNGALAVEEMRDFASVRRHHGVNGGQEVRVFPRLVDAVLLAGLQRAVGGRFLEVQHLRARYALEEDKVLIKDIAVDGEVRPSVFELQPIRECSTQ